MKRQSAKQVEKKRELEKEVIGQMIAIYCKGNKHQRGTDGLCDSCRALTAYVKMRTDHCPFMEEKTFCSNCRVHCLCCGAKTANSAGDALCCAKNALSQAYHVCLSCVLYVE